MRLSVIVPILNGEAPRSLREQAEGRTDVELVVVRGVSPVGRARNEGLLRATGDYVAWVDGDDEVADDWLKTILDSLSEGPDAVVFAFKWMMDAQFGFEKIWRGGDLLGAVLRQDVLCSELCNKVVRRALWEGVRFDDAARTMEDWEVLPRVLSGARRVACVERPLYRYYVRKDSLTHQTDESMQQEQMRRAVGRVDEIKRLGLWGRYGRDTMVGVGRVVYDCAETLEFGGSANCPTKREAERWIIRHLPVLLLTPARLTYKAKWILAAFGGWRVVRWYYARIQGQKL